MNTQDQVSNTRQLVLYACLLLCFYLFAYLLPLGARDLFVPDETRYAEVPREMIASGDWAVPHLNGLRYFENPALGYWVHAASQLLFGENDFAVRLPSALSVGLSALLVFFLVQRGRGRREKRKRLHRLQPPWSFSPALRSLGSAIPPFWITFSLFYSPPASPLLLGHRG